MSFIERLKLQKPNIFQLKEQRFTAFDMHVHSMHSDGLNKIETILKKARKARFGVAITDHNEIKGSIEAVKIAKDVMVIPGMEINTSDGPDILLYFYNIHEATEYYNKHIKKHKGFDPSGKSKVSLKDIYDHSKDYNCVISAAHPCGPAWKNLKKFLNKNPKERRILKMFDAIEVVNSEMTRKMNVRAILWNLALNKSITGGSDAHTLGEVGNTLTYSDGDDVESFLDRIKKDKSYVIGKETKLRRKILSTSNNLRKHWKYITPNLTMSLDYEINKVLRPFMKKELHKLKNGDFSRILKDNRIVKKLRQIMK